MWCSVETIPELIRLLAEAPPEERVLPNPMDLLHAAQFRLQTSRASSVGTQPVSPASVASNEYGSVTPAFPTTQQQIAAPVAGVATNRQTIAAPAVGTQRSESTGRVATARPSEPSTAAPAAPTSAVFQTVGPAKPSRHEWYTQHPAEVNAPREAVSPFATPAEREASRQQSAEFAAARFVSAPPAEYTPANQSQGAIAKVVSPEYAAGVLATAAIPRPNVGDPANPQQPYMVSGVQVTPNIRVDFVVPPPTVFDAKAMFEAADRLTARAAPNAPTDVTPRNLFQPPAAAGVESTSEMVSQHFVSRQSSQLDRRY